ncbi:MAG: hypothetical protein HZA01_15300 [Nitrospinae bacterium]|nr:hypothetical protein [Nitrospinota bacterium]
MRLEIKTTGLITLSLAAFLFLPLAGCARDNSGYIKRTVRDLTTQHHLDLKRVKSSGDEPKNADGPYRYTGLYKDRRVDLVLDRDDFKGVNSMELSVWMEKPSDFSIEVGRRNELSRLFHPKGISKTPALYHDYIVDSDHEKRAMDFLGGFQAGKYFSRLRNFEKLSLGPERVKVLYQSKYPLQLDPSSIVKILDTLLMLSEKLSGFHA